RHPARRVRGRLRRARRAFRRRWVPRRHEPVGLAVASWAEFEQAAQGLAANVQARFRSYRHCLLATLRADGSPRLSGIEVQFTQGHLWMGMMSGSMKARDLQRDGRMALHSVLDT